MKKKFETAINSKIHRKDDPTNTITWVGGVVESAKECEKLADDFAIGFSNWIDSSKCDYTKIEENQWQHYKLDRVISDRELLHIFKKNYCE